MASQLRHREPAQVLPFQPVANGPALLEASRRKSSVTCRQKAGLLAIFLGTLGFHKFYLGHWTEGCVHITLGITSLVMVMMLQTLLPLVAVVLFSAMEGVIYLSRTEEQFERDYLKEGRRWL